MLDRYQAIDPNWLALAAGARLLDVGCGTGRHLLELSRYPGLLVGLDASFEELRTLRNWLLLTRRERIIKANVHRVMGAGERLPFPDDFFRQVICTETLEHVPDDRAVLRELVRVLEPGGVLAISVPDEYSERLLWRLSPRYRNTPGGHVRIYRRRQIAGLLQEFGVDPVATRFRQSLETLRWFARSVIDREWAKPGRATKAIYRLLDTPSHRNWRFLAWSDWLGNLLLPKSVVVYGRKRERAHIAPPSEASVTLPKRLASTEA